MEYIKQSTSNVSIQTLPKTWYFNYHVMWDAPWLFTTRRLRINLIRIPSKICIAGLNCQPEIHMMEIPSSLKSIGFPNLVFVDLRKIFHSVRSYKQIYNYPWKINIHSAQ